MDRDDVTRWVAGYEDAWRTGDLDALDGLFGRDVSYSRAPYREPSIGLDAVKEFWLEDEGAEFTVESSIVAFDPPNAVVRLQVQYERPARQQYRDLWVLRFDADGRVEHYEEWPFWPEVTPPLGPV